MEIVVFVCQVILSIMMLVFGGVKLAYNKEQLKAKGDGRMDYVDDLYQMNVKLIGLTEMLIGLGLILPQLICTDLDYLIPLAALGAVLTMIGAVIIHIKRKDDLQAIMINIIIMLIAVVILYGKISNLSTIISC